MNATEKFQKIFVKKISKKFSPRMHMCIYYMSRLIFEFVANPSNSLTFFIWFLPNIYWKFRHLKVFTFVFISILSFLRSENFYINIHFLFHFLSLIHLFTLLHFFVGECFNIVTFLHWFIYSHCYIFSLIHLFTLLHFYICNLW